MFRRTWKACPVGEPVVCIHHGIPKVIEDSAVESVRAGAGSQDGLTSGRPPEFWRERRRLNTKLLQGIHGNQATSSSEGAESLCTTCSRFPTTSCPRRDAEVRRNAVDRETVRVCPLSRNTERTGRGRVACGYHAACR